MTCAAGVACASVASRQHQSLAVWVTMTQGSQVDGMTGSALCSIRPSPRHRPGWAWPGAADAFPRETVAAPPGRAIA